MTRYEQKMRRSGWWLVTVLCTGLFGMPAISLASPFNVYGMSSRATAMGGAQGAAARDAASMYYNPANLTLRENTQFMLSSTFIAPHLSLEHDNLFDDDDIILPNRNVTLTLGFTFPLGGLLDHRVGIGFALSVPLIELTRLQAMDPSTPHFYIYQSLPDHLVIAPAIGFRIFDWLRVGAGVQLLAALSAELSMSADLSRRRIDERSLSVDLNGRAGPILGIHGIAGPVEIGFTYRDSLSLDYQLPVTLNIDGIGPLDLLVTGTTLYSPEMFNLGLSVNLDEPRLVIAADLTYERWSDAPDPSAHIDASLAPSELLGIDDPLIQIDTQIFDLGAVDILVPHFGAEWFIDDIWIARAGYSYRPATVPDQTGYSNVLDNNASVYSIGGAASFADPLHATDEVMTIDLHLQVNHLISRTTLKDPDAEGTFEGAYRAGGVIWNLGLDFRQDF